MTLLNHWAQYLFVNIKFTRDTNMPFPKTYIDDTFICSYLTYRVSIIRHTLLILTHVRLPKHPDSLFCHRVLPRNFTSAVHVCSTSRKIIRKRERGEEGGRVNTLCGIQPWLIRLTFLSRDESNNDEGASKLPEWGGSGAIRGMFRPRYKRYTNIRISEY